MDLLRQELRAPPDRTVGTDPVVVFRNESLDPRTTPSMEWLGGVEQMRGTRWPFVRVATQHGDHPCLQSRTSLW